MDAFKLLDGEPAHDIVAAMAEQEAFWLSQADESFSEGEFLMSDAWTLDDVESALQTRLEMLSKRNTGDYDSPPFDDFLDCYNALIQVEQARALGKIAALLRGGIPVERIS